MRTLFMMLFYMALAYLAARVWRDLFRDEARWMAW